MQMNGARDDRVAYITGEVNTFRVGDDNTPPTGADVALGNEIAVGAGMFYSTGSTGVVTCRARIPGPGALTIRETGAFGVGFELLDRIVHADVVKPNGVELVIDIRYEVRNP